jgi:hypothetical protein
MKMTNEFIGTLLLVIIGFLSFVGIGSLILSIIFDPDESDTKIYNPQLILEEPVLEKENTDYYSQLKDS